MSWNSFIIKTLKPPNNELCSVLGAALKKNFKKVHVELTKCPDLTAAPFRMTGTGFGRNMVIAEVGGLGNLYPGFHKDKHYDLKDICNKCEAPNAFAFGPAGCPIGVVGKNGELFADVNFAKNKVGSKITTLVDNQSVPFETRAISSTKFTLTGNFIVTADPGPAEVVHIKCSERIGRQCFPGTLREGLAQRYGKECVVLGGLFLLLRGKARVHIAPDFPKNPWNSMDEVEQWFRTFVVNTPLLCASVMHSYDPGFKLRMQHTHCVSDHNDAGHFENDATPEEAEYEGWFTAAEKMYRIDEI